MTGLSNASSLMATRRIARFPNRERAIPLEEAPANLSAGEFLERYVSRHRPCVIRSGAADWKSVRTWSIGHFRKAIPALYPLGGNQGLILSEPLIEYESTARRKARVGQMTFGEFLDRCESDACDFLHLYGVSFAGDMEGLRHDIGAFQFFRFPEDVPEHGASPSRKPQAAQGYRFRMFMSKEGYTDWHFHTQDESLTTQVVGEKELLMLPPDRATFEALMPAARRGVWQVPEEEQAPEFRSLVPVRVLLRPGDVLYIPQYWWHAAEGSGFNVTVARPFRTPLRWAAELRLPGAQHALKGHLRSIYRRQVPGAQNNRSRAYWTKAVVRVMFGSAWALVRNGRLGAWTGATEC